MGCERYWDQFPQSLPKPCRSRLQHQGKAASWRVAPAPECRDGRPPHDPSLLPVVLPLSLPCPHQNRPPPSPAPTAPAEAEVPFPDETALNC